MAYTSEIEKLERRFAENPTGRNFAPLADAYRKAGELDRAIELCKGGLERHPDYVSAHIVYGRCLIDKKDDAEAEQVFQRILGLDPENIIALKVLADLADRNNRFDGAVQWLTRLLAADPMNGDAAEALARAKGKAAVAAKTTEPMEAATAEPAARDAQLIDVDAAMAEAPTTAITKPEFEIERASASHTAPAVPTTAQPAGDLEVFDGTVDFNAVANAAAKAEGLELQEEVELKADAVPLEGLARTQYEGSGMFRLDAQEEPAAEAAAPPPAPPPPAPLEPEEPMPPVDLPLIMPEEIEASVARKTPAPQPPPPPAPPAPPAPAPVSAPPAAVALSDDDGATDMAALSQAEPVVTETMAELYLRQGHQEEALRVYEALLAQRPGDGRLQTKVEELSGRAVRAVSKRKLAKSPDGPSAPEFIRRVLRGEAVSVTPVPPPIPTEPSALEGAFAAVPVESAPEAEASAPPGAPTQPADDNISLDAVFGDQVGRPSGTELPATPAPAPVPPGTTGGFSFDDFFGAAPPPAAGGKAAQPQQKPRTSGRTTRTPENDADLDQFQSWLKGLKS